MMDVGGQDATEAFEDVGHSDEAREILNGLLIGNLKRQVCPLYKHSLRQYSRPSLAERVADQSRSLATQNQKPPPLRQHRPTRTQTA